MAHPIACSHWFWLRRTKRQGQISCGKIHVRMHIPPGSGKARAVFKLPSVATGMKSKTESEGNGDERGGRAEKGMKERQSSTHLSCLFLFLFGFFSPHNSPANRFFLLLKNKTKQTQTKIPTCLWAWNEVRALRSIFWDVLQGSAMLYAMLV